MMNPTELAERYVALWNEPDLERRREAVHALWTEDGGQILLPPEEIRERAATLGFFDSFLQACGHAALERRATVAYEAFVAPGGAAFRQRGGVTVLGDAVKFEWEFVPLDGGPATGGGTEFALLAPDGRIRNDYQFIDG